MGILNASPDSFYDQGHTCFEKVVAHGQALIEEGGDILDIGGASSRPGALPLPLSEEAKRVLPLIEILAPIAKSKGVILSIDTFHPEIAEKAVALGVTFINDITALQDPRMQELAKTDGVRCCLMHMQGTPETMQQNPHYPQGVVVEVREWLQKRAESLIKSGLKAEQIVLDPGIGFGKSVDDCVEILKNLRQFCDLGFPILIGLSRKSFLQKILQKSASELLSTTLAMNTMSLLEGAEIIRVHDVKEHRSIVDLFNLINL